MAAAPDSSTDTARLDALIQSARNPTTRGAYETDVAHFVRWCDQHELAPLPAAAATLSAYLASLADGTAPLVDGSSPLATGHWQLATIERRRSSIAKFHRLAEVESPSREPAVLAAMGAIRAELGGERKHAEPLLPEAMQTAAAAMAASTDLRDVRDLAIVLVGFAGALRRSELAALDHEHLTFDARGVWLMLPKRRDADGRLGVRVGVPTGHGATCPVRALRAWIARLGRITGSVFVGLSCAGTLRNRIAGGEIPRVVRKFAARAGLDPAKFSGHSLRLGFLAEATRLERPMRSIQQQTGHATPAEVRRAAKGWSGNAARGML